MKQAVKYYLKEFLGFSFLAFGGVSLINHLCRKEPFLVVLNYHSFSKFNNFKIQRGSILETGYASNFEKQMKWLKKHFKFLYPEEFFEGNPDKGLNVLVTFDDGYKDNHDLALPILTTNKAKVIFFITTAVKNTSNFLIHDQIRYLIQNDELNPSYGAIPTKINRGEQNYNLALINEVKNKFGQIKNQSRLMMNNEEIENILKAGFKIGNHTHNHIGLTFLDKQNQETEIKFCQKKLQMLKNTNDIDCIAYPNGLYNCDTLTTLDKLKIRYGFTIKPGVNSKNNDEREIRRLGINVSDSIGIILIKIFLAKL